jgi:hypothetical protein
VRRLLRNTARRLVLDQGEHFLELVVHQQQFGAGIVGQHPHKRPRQAALVLLKLGRLG